MFQTKFVEKIKTHTLCSIPFFFENRAVYEIMWINMLEPDMPQITIRRMRFRCWMTKATDTHTEYLIFIAFSTATILTRTRINVMFIRTLHVLLLRNVM
jgi:hypothetical protein